MAGDRPSENPYFDQIDRIERKEQNNNYDPELERLRLENENLRLKLLLESKGELDNLKWEIQNGRQFEESEYITPNIDFKIISGKSIRKEIGIEHHGGLKFSKDEKQIKESIYDLNIINKGNNLGEFEISFKINGEEYNLLYLNGENQILLMQNGRYKKLNINMDPFPHIKIKDDNREIILKIDFKRHGGKHGNGRRY